MSKGRVVILTALNLEYEAVLKELVDVAVHWHPAGTRFETGHIGEGGCEVALGLVGKGNHPAAVLAERAIAEFSPAALLFVGVAGALWPNIKLGDIVIASQVYAYHGGTSEDDGFKARPRTWEISHRAAQIVQHLIRTDGWHGRLEAGNRSQAHFGPIAAGEVVQDSALSEHARWIRDHYNDALAVEMEAAGVAQAGHLNRSLPVVVIRGISDRADGTKSSSDGKSWQPRAAAHAAAFAAVLAHQMSTDINENGSKPMSATYHNTATGDARVGVMAGQIHGNITFGGDQDQPTDPPAAIADLRGRIKDAHRRGQLDPATYAAAEAELDTASRSLSDKGKLLLALKRFRGLIADVAEIAVVVGAIIASLKSLP